MAFNWFKKKDDADAEPKAPEPRTDPADLASGNAVAHDEPEAATAEAADPPSPETPVAVLSTDLPEDAPPAGQTQDPMTGDARRKPKVGLFRRLKKGLSKTRDILTTDIDDLFGGSGKLDDELLDDLEELLITSDMGVQTAMDLMKIITKKAAKIEGPEELKAILRQEILGLLKGIADEPPVKIGHPHVVMVVGVNGVGKTTTIGKLAARTTENGQSVLIAAADTFRAAAVEQLAIWAERAGAELVRHKENADPAAVAYDGIEAAMARGIDTVFVDTAGRLHTKVNLMEELKKIRRTISKKIPDAPHEILLVLDATTGQNALSQAKLFNEAMGITGLALTKLDGTAKGGIVISICQSLNIPLHYIGVGEDIHDLQAFDPEKFADALF